MTGRKKKKGRFQTHFPMSVPETKEQHKWLLFGGKGWIGAQIAALLRARQQRVILATARANDPEGVQALLDEHKPDRVLLAIGRTHGPGAPTIDYLEDKGMLPTNLRDNLAAAVVMATLCQRRQIHLTYLGTGCIFTYDTEHPCADTKVATRRTFTEEDAPNFAGSAYSAVKGCTDQLMCLFPDTVLNVRIRMPITADAHPRSFLAKIANYARVCSVPNSMTVLPELLPLMLDLAQRGETGTINLTNPGAISHNQVLALYREVVDPSFTWQNFDVEEQNRLLKAARSNNELDTTRLQRLCPSVSRVEVALRRVMEQLRDQGIRLRAAAPTASAASRPHPA